MPTTVVFDLDNTLYDETTAKVAGECAVAEALGHDLGTTTVDALERYKESKQRVLAQRHLGPMRSERWRWTIDLVHDETRARELHELYWDTVSEQIAPYADALVALPLLRARADLWIATNEHASIQERKLAKLGLTHHFRGVVSADTVGHEKPSAEFFAHLAEQLGSDDVLFVGDNPRTDIAGACVAGHRTAWLRRGSYARVDAASFPGCEPTYEIEHLTELVTIVSG